MINHRASGVQGEQRKYCFDGGARGAWKHLGTFTAETLF